MAVFLAVFVISCTILIAQSTPIRTAAVNSCIMLQSAQEDSETSKTGLGIEMVKPTTEIKEPEGIDWTNFAAAGGDEQMVIIGAKDPCTEDPQTGFKFQLMLNSYGAAIQNVTFSDGGGKGFDDLDYKNPRPLGLLKPVEIAGDSIMSMANKEFTLVEKKTKIPLDKLPWRYLGTNKLDDGGERAYFQASIIKNMMPIIKITKTYCVRPGDYLVDCDIFIENESESELTYRFNMNGPLGIDKEDFRGDDRTAIIGLNQNGQVISDRKKINTFGDINKHGNKDVFNPNIKGSFLWCGIVNKYFACLVVPLPDENKEFCDWINGKLDEKSTNNILTKEKKGFRYSITKFLTRKEDTEEFIDNGKLAVLYDPDTNKAGDENIGIELGIDYDKLAASSRKVYKFQLYFGPKDNSLFNRVKRFKELGFIQTIDFLSCCCPAKMINPMAFGILWLMEWLYSFLRNYGIVIIILVFVVRLILHPLTKKGQVSMGKMGKLAPKVEQLKKKYADDKGELNKQIMALYKEQGASPFTGMLPMFIQMPIWIALYSAINASISLRGAAFLPVWITNLSAPDALFRFQEVTIPLLGWKISSFNLLPILMGIAFYLQQKLTPTQPGASTNPQLAQQQKMMMIMIPIMFPLMLYSAPSGLNLYIMASTFAGAVEQYFIKKHIRKKDEAEEKGLVPVTSKTGGKVKKKKPKPFFKNK